MLACITNISSASFSYDFHDDQDSFLFPASLESLAQRTMADPVTEIATVPLRPNVTIGDVHSPAQEVSVAWKDFLTVVSAQEGFQRCYFGRQVESSHVLDLFIGKVTVTLIEAVEAFVPYLPFSYLLGLLAVHIICKTHYFTEA